MSQKTRAQMLAEIAALLPTNGSGLITAAALRTVENDMSDSVFMPLTDGTPVLNTRTVNAHPLSADVTVTKADVGLGNADNTSDAAKPVSTDQQTALNLKLNVADPAATGSFQLDASGRFFTVDDEGVHSDVPIICQPLTIGNADPTTLDRVTSFVYYNRADAQAIVVHEISDVSDGQPLTISNNIASPVQITAVAANSFFNGSLGIVSAITLAAKETIMLVVFGNLWRVAARYSGEAIPKTQVFVLATFIFDGAGSPPVAATTTNSKTLPVGYVITGYSISTKTSGSISLDLQRAAGGGSFSSIVASAPCVLSSSNFVNSATLTGWTTTLSANDRLEAVVNSASGLDDATLEIYGRLA